MGTWIADIHHETDRCPGPGRRGEERCDNKVQVKSTGLCSAHHEHHLKGIELRPLRERSRESQPCKGPGHGGKPCGLRVQDRALMLCQSHLMQFKRGKPLTALQRRRQLPAGTMCKGPGAEGPCDRPVSYVRTGLCWSHEIQRKDGLGLKPLKPYRHSDDPRGECAFVPCIRERYSRGLCSLHYQQSMAGRDLTMVSVGPHIPGTARDGKGRKYCRECHAWKQVGRFAVNKSREDELMDTCRGCVADARILSVYGLTPDEYEEILRSQGGGCAICGLQPTPGKRLAVDHDHSCCDGDASCGRCVRGLLCDAHNFAIGAFRDDLLLIRRAITYLMESPFALDVDRLRTRSGRRKPQKRNSK